VTEGKPTNCAPDAPDKNNVFHAPLKDNHTGRPDAGTKRSKAGWYVSQNRRPYTRFTTRRRASVFNSVDSFQRTGYDCQQLIRDEANDAFTIRSDRLHAHHHYYDSTSDDAGVVAL